MPRKFNATKAAEAALFNGKSPEEVRTLLGIPDDFHVQEFLGVPIDKVPDRYIRVMLDGAILEARMAKRQLGLYEDALAKGEELNALAEKQPEEKAAP